MKKKKKRSAGTGNDGNSDNSDNSDPAMSPSGPFRGSISGQSGNVKKSNRHSKSVKSNDGDKNNNLDPPFFPHSDSNYTGRNDDIESSQSSASERLLPNSHRQSSRHRSASLGGLLKQSDPDSKDPLDKVVIDLNADPY